MRKKPLLAILPIAVAAVGLSVAGAASGKTGPTAASKLPSSSCGPVFYKGSGSPRYLIASDLPLQGAGRAQPLSMVKAIQYVLEKQYNFRAGQYTVGYQSCDDATAQQGGWATEKCTANARSYANDRDGARRARDVQLRLRKARDSDPEPRTGWPVGHDQLGKHRCGSDAQRSVERPRRAEHLLPDEDPQLCPRFHFGRLPGPVHGGSHQEAQEVERVHPPRQPDVREGCGQRVQGQGDKIGLKVLGFEPWDAKAASYEAIGERIKATGAKAVYLAGIVCNNGVKLIKDIGAVLGKGVTLAAPDGFTPYSATAGAGAAAQGMYISYAGVPLSLLGPKGKAFLKGFAKYQGRSVVDPYAVYAAQTAQIMLGAIGNSNGSRLSVVRNVYKTKVAGGIMGTFQFDKVGDICPFKTISFNRLVGTEGKFYSYVRQRASC